MLAQVFPSVFPSDAPGRTHNSVYSVSGRILGDPAAFNFIASHTSASLGNDSAFSYLRQLFFYPLSLLLTRPFLSAAHLPVIQPFNLRRYRKKRIPTPSGCEPELNQTFHEGPELIRPSSAPAMTAAVTMGEKVILWLCVFWGGVF